MHVKNTKQEHLFLKPEQVSKKCNDNIITENAENPIKSRQHKTIIIMKKLFYCMALFAAVTLTACGGGNGNGKGSQAANADPKEMLIVEFEKACRNVDPERYHELKEELEHKYWPCDFSESQVKRLQQANAMYQLGLMKKMEERDN